MNVITEPANQLASSQSKRLPITLAVMTYNEADNIARCLASVPFAAEKLVVDCGSTDDTVAIAVAHGARVVEQKWLGFSQQRNFTSAQAQYDWILMLDADEFLSDALQRECSRRLQDFMERENLGVVQVRRTTYYMGRPMRWYRPMLGEQLGRFYHRNRANWRDVRVHESLQTKSQVALLKAPLHHLHNPTLVHKQLKVLRYSELKAQDWCSKQKPTRMWLCPLVYIATFFKDYVFRLAVFDGWRGFVVAQIAANYAVYKRMRYYEMQQNPDSIISARALLRHHQLEHQ